MVLCSYFFFSNEKTEYRLRMSDWSSDVCSSDLRSPRRESPFHRAGIGADQHDGVGAVQSFGHRLTQRSGGNDAAVAEAVAAVDDDERKVLENGSAACRERVCQSVLMSGIAVLLKKQTNLLKVI